MTVYSNLPTNTTTTNLQKVVQYFDSYYSTPINLDATSIDVLKGFFESKGFDLQSAENITYIILKTAKQSNYKPQEIIDALSAYDRLQLNDFLLSILNYNRIKTSSLGVIRKSSTISQIANQIRA
jgi:hypothetical protein